MEVIEPGHEYDPTSFGRQSIRFMKRVGDGYPGNEPPRHGGTNCQELLRVLIDRVKYLDDQDHDSHNDMILRALRNGLFWFEKRAAERRGEAFDFHSRLINWGKDAYLQRIENAPACPTCGHLLCLLHSRSEAAP